jgi:hypothetical protein
VSKPADPARELPPVSFSSLIVSFASSAMSQMGEGPDAEMNMELARHSVDVLSLLRDKTKGNLDEEESKLLETLLYETRMKFMEKAKAGA